MKDILAWIKVPFKVIVTIILIGSCILLFTGESMVQKLYLTEFKEQYGKWIGVAFIVSVGFCAYFLFGYLNGFIEKKYRLPHVQKKLLEDLNDVEIAIVMHVFNSPNYCAELDMNSPVVIGLVAKHILFSGGSQLVSVDYITGIVPVKYTLQPFVIKIINGEMEKANKKIKKLERKLERCSDDRKKLQIETEVRKLQ